MIELRHGRARATIDHADGGRVTSLSVGRAGLLVEATDDGRGIPRNGSFLMAPWVAEVASGELMMDGATYRLPTSDGRHAVHGLVMRGPWAVTSHGDRQVSMERELARPWPFGGHVRQEIVLDHDGITLVAEVTAGDQAMPAAVGWHPWFRCADPEATRVWVAADRCLELDEELLPSGRSVPVTGDVDLRDGPILGTRAIDVVYQDVMWPIEYSMPGVRVRVEADPATTIGVVYTSPGAICIEPWSAWPDAFHMADRGFASGAVRLAPGATLRRWTRWCWTVTA